MIRTSHKRDIEKIPYDVWKGEKLARGWMAALDALKDGRKIPSKELAEIVRVAGNVVPKTSRLIISSGFHSGALSFTGTYAHATGKDTRVYYLDDDGSATANYMLTIPARVPIDKSIETPIRNRFTKRAQRPTQSVGGSATHPRHVGGGGVAASGDAVPSHYRVTPVAPPKGHPKDPGGSRCYFAGKGDHVCEGATLPVRFQSGRTGFLCEPAYQVNLAAGKIEDIDE